MNDIFIRGLDLPVKVRGVVVLDDEGNYNIYINTRLSYEMQQRAAQHELVHIKEEHFFDFEPVVHNELEANAI